MKKLLGLLAVAPMSIAACTTTDYSDRLDQIEADLDSAEAELENLQVGFKNAAESFESAGLFDLMIEAYGSNNDLAKTMWQKWMPETVTMDLRFTLADSWGTTVIKDIEYVDYVWEGTTHYKSFDNTATAVAGINYAFFYTSKGTSTLFDTLTVDGTTVYEVEDLVLHRSPFNRQYLLLDPENCTYEGFMSCDDTNASADYTSVAAA